jgi:alkanesulfonate monooxygenase SsuD/methylene tetrahydromethanopterin reductase-like flavin-dependent oxidoreductase (luciferase family)
MIDRFESPAWVTEAFTKAGELAREANAFWLEQLGDLGQFGGFQIRPSGTQQDVLFQSVLFGGRSLVGSAEQVAAGSREYVLSRRPGRAKEAE